MRRDSGIIASVLVSWSLILMSASSMAADAALTFVGNTVFPDAELQNLAATEGSAPLDPEQAVAVSQRVTRHYIDAGFVNSGVVPVRQDDGRYIFQVTEGTLTDITVDAPRFRPSHIERVIRAAAAPPFNVAELQQAVTRLERHPAVDYVTGHLTPGDVPGEARLALTVHERRPWSLAVLADNYLPPSEGESQVRLEAVHHNLTGGGDVLRISADDADGSESFSVNYRLALSGSGSHLRMGYVDGDTQVVESPFDRLDIRSETDEVSIGVETDLVDTRRRLWQVGFLLERKRSRSLLFGEPFDFTFGSKAGRSQASVFELSSQYVLRGAEQALTGRIAWRRGIDFFLERDEQVTDFDALILQGKYSRRMTFGDKSWRLDASANAQLTRDVLKSFERYGLGGRYSVRGYRENHLLRDNAVELSVSAVWPAMLPGGFTVDWVAFVDAGRAWNAPDAAPSGERFREISSAGLGAVLKHSSGFSMEAFWAERFAAKARAGGTLQDDGIHVSVSYAM